MIGLCAYCDKDLDLQSGYIEGIIEGKALNFCDEECCKEYLFEYADIVALDNPNYSSDY